MRKRILLLLMSLLAVLMFGSSVLAAAATESPEEPEKPVLLRWRRCLKQKTRKTLQFTEAKTIS